LTSSSTASRPSSDGSDSHRYVIDVATGNVGNAPDDLAAKTIERVLILTSLKGNFVEKRLVTRYATQSPSAADENQARIEGVFAELDETKPNDVSYIVLRLADDSFVHLSFHNHRDDERNPISSTAAFAHFQDGHETRRSGAVDQQTATLVGSYITEIG
jgi:predicted SnoaL-like aldol condensation-catalyzing enzyme